MDISSDLQEILNDESFRRAVQSFDNDQILNEKPNAAKITTPRATKSKPACFQKDASAGALSIGDLKTIHSVEPESDKVDFTLDWCHFEKTLDCVISASLRPILDFVIGSLISTDNIGNIGKRLKVHLMHLFNDLITEYKLLYKQAYSMEGYLKNDDKTECLFETNILDSFNALSCIPSQGDDNEQEKNLFDSSPSQVNEKASMNWSSYHPGNHHSCDSGLLKNHVVQLLSQRQPTSFYKLISILLDIRIRPLDSVRLCNAMDLLCGIISTMPMLTMLFITPHAQDMRESDHQKQQQKQGINEKPVGYFKLIVDAIKSQVDVDAIGNVRNNNFVRLYTRCIDSKYHPFYMIPDGSKAANKFEKCISTVYLLHRLLKFVRLIIGWFLDLYNDLKIDGQLKRKLMKQFKKYIMLPLFRIRKLHEILVPLSGVIQCPVMHADIQQLLKSYIYPPPPLLVLRLDLLDILYIFAIITCIHIGDIYNRVNSRLSRKLRSKGIILNQPKARVNVLLRRYLFLFLVSCSFIVSADFMKQSTDNINGFLGVYYTMLPTFKLSICFGDIYSIIEDGVYTLQQKCLEIIHACMGNVMLANKNTLGLGSRDFIMDNLIKRLLILCWHYFTASEVYENMNNISKGIELDVNGSTHNNEIIPRQYLNSQCQGRCSMITPYNVLDLILLKPFKGTLAFTCAEPLLKKVPKQPVAACEIEHLAKHVQCTLDYCSSSMFRDKMMEYGYMHDCPFQLVMDSRDVGSCGLDCILLIHLLQGKNCQQDIKEKRILIVKSGLLMLGSFCKNHGSTAFGNLEPIWYALLHALKKL
ncbi:hypothetical protein BdWA1_002395 [Babesia duncani]|uniref:Uncharacterized protein n=1 Tax=Babesia duncani TaxID=323732 RepID=A0AAD9PJM7_9APIC|nr:hypothetical protein BdWA1_002395 [Babesia duncani]